MGRLQDVYAEIEQKSNRINEFHDQIGEDAPTEDQMAQVVDLGKAVEKLEREALELEQRKASFATAHQTAQQRLASINAPQHPSRHGNPRPESGSPAGNHQQAVEILGKSLGQAVLDDVHFKNWIENLAIGGHISPNQRISSPKIESKTLITGASVTSGGATVIPTQYPGVVPLPFRPLVLRDLITVGQTSSDSVEFVRVTSYTNNAAGVAEATATSGASGAKPESAMAMERVNEPVKTIAHWIPATTRALADGNQIRSLIDAFLRDGLNQTLEDEMITGDGTGEHFTGVLNTTGTTAQAFATDILTTTRKGRTKVRTVGRAVPTGYVLNPVDWESLDLSQDNEARYYYGGPSATIIIPRLWGLPVAECEAMTAGTGIVGDLRQMVLWDREQATIQVSNSHSDFFIRNLLAILAELRAAFGVLRPPAIVEMALA